MMPPAGMLLLGRLNKFNKFEDSLSSSLPEPSTPEYERETQPDAGSDIPIMEVKEHELLDLSNLSFIN